jgi:tRNA nucleotidyltransferase/poly(A) polymerase
MPELKRIEELLKAKGVDYFFIGGALRDVFLNKDPSDIDMISTATPGDIMSIARSEGIDARFVNPETGTVRLRFGKPVRLFDIVSFDSINLRQGSISDRINAYLCMHGDLTMNALGMHPDGRWFDPLGGIAHLHEGVIRLTDSAIELLPLNENRLIRLLRFHALYGKKPLDDDIVQVCRKHAGALEYAHKGKLMVQFFKWVVVPKFADSLQLSRQLGLLPYIFPFALDEQEIMRRYEVIQRMSKLPQDVEVRMVLLMQKSGMTPETALDIFAKRWDIQPVAHQRMQNLILRFPQVRNSVAMQHGKALAEALGRHVACQLVLLHWAHEPDVMQPAASYRKLLEDIYAA